MRILTMFLFAAAVIVSGSVSEASRIANGASSSIGNPNIDLTSATVSTGSENNPLNPLLDNTVTINLSVKQLQLPQTFTFNLVNNTASLPFNAAESTRYRVTVNPTNDTVVPHVISGFDMRVLANGANWNAPAISHASVSSPDFWVAPNFRLNAVASATDNTYRFGGLNGSGGEILPSGSGTVSFDLDIIGTFVSNANSTLAFTFTANPEPTSLLLGSLVMVPAGIVIRRRRKAAADVVA